MAERGGLNEPSSTSPADVRLLVLDVDGVLTDGGLYYDHEGRETKRFDVRDGQGIKAAQRAGLTVGIITARQSEAVRVRAAELGIEHVHQGVSEKLSVFANLCAECDVPPSSAAYMGDDLPDLAVLEACGYPMSVPDAASEVQRLARYVTTRPGGYGAVREAVEHLLRPGGRWDAQVNRYRPVRAEAGDPPSDNR